MFLRQGLVLGGLLFNPKRQLKPWLAPRQAFVRLTEAFDRVLGALEAPCYRLFAYEISPLRKPNTGRVQVRLLREKRDCRR